MKGAHVELKADFNLSARSKQQLRTDPEPIPRQNHHGVVVVDRIEYVEDVVAATTRTADVARVSKHAGNNVTKDMSALSNPIVGLLATA